MFRFVLFLLSLSPFASTCFSFFGMSSSRDATAKGEPPLQPQLPSASASALASAPPSIDEGLPYWMGLSQLIACISVSAAAPTSSEAAVYTRYTLQCILLFCGIKQHRVWQLVDHMMAQMLAAAFVSPSPATTTTANTTTAAATAPTVLLVDEEDNADSAVSACGGPVRRPTSLPLLVEDWLMLSAAKTQSYAPAYSPHRHCPHRYELHVPALMWERTIIKTLGNGLRGQMISLRPLLRWDTARAQQSGHMPVVILIGGTSGSGKSTLARLVASQLHIPNVLSTDTVRQVLRSRLAGREKDYPTLFLSTYEAYKALGEGVAADAQPQDVVTAYESQCELVLEVLDGMLARLLARRESVVIEGVHLLPKYMAAKRAELLVDHVTCVPVLVRIPKADRHLERFCVRSRGMSLRSDNNKYIASFQAIRAIQSHLVTTVEAAAMPVLVLTNTNVDKSFLVLHHAVLETMEHTALHGWPTDAAATAQVPLTPLAFAFAATKRRLVAVVRQRRTRRDTVAGAAAEGGAGNVYNGFVFPHANGVGSGDVVAAAAASSRARSAELLSTAHRGRPCSPRQPGLEAHRHPSNRIHESLSSQPNSVPDTNNVLHRSPTTQNVNPDSLSSPAAVADGGDSPFRAFAPRRSTTTNVPQLSSVGGAYSMPHDGEETFDEVEVPSLMGS